MKKRKKKRKRKPRVSSALKESLRKWDEAMHAKMREFAKLRGQDGGLTESAQRRTQDNVYTMRESYDTDAKRAAAACIRAGNNYLEQYAADTKGMSHAKLKLMLNSKNKELCQAEYDKEIEVVLKVMRWEIKRPLADGGDTTFQGFLFDERLQKDGVEPYTYGTREEDGTGKEKLKCSYLFKKWEEVFKRKANKERKSRSFRSRFDRMNAEEFSAFLDEKHLEHTIYRPVEVWARFADAECGLGRDGTNWGWTRRRRR